MDENRGAVFLEVISDNVRIFAVITLLRVACCVLLFTHRKFKNRNEEV